MKGGEAMENGVFRLGCEESHEGEIEWFVLCCVVLCFVGFGFGFGFLCGIWLPLDIILMALRTCKVKFWG